MVLTENVPEARFVHPAFTRDLEAAGYEVHEAVLRACDYGAPQLRRRWFVFATRRHLPFRWPVATHTGDPGVLSLTLERTPTWRELTGVPVDVLTPVTAGEGRGMSAAWRTRHPGGTSSRLADRAGRRIEPAEAAAGQGFPASWQWSEGCYGDTMRQIGEAVYVPLAAAIAREIVAADRAARAAAVREAAREDVRLRPDAVIEAVVAMSRRGAG
jgi:DNA (cytosine-5)-methyltransferase 1